MVGQSVNGDALVYHDRGRGHHRIYDVLVCVHGHGLVWTILVFVGAATMTPLPTLPTEDDPASEAVRSVVRREFYVIDLPITGNRAIMAQFLRLVEEVGEYEFEIEEGNDEAACDELADVFIVMSQIAWLTGMDPAQLWTAKQDIDMFSMSLYVGIVARWLRKNKLGILHDELQNMAALIHNTARQRNIDFESVVRAKLAADELRGVRHGEDVQPTSPSKFAMKAPVQTNGGPPQSPHVWRDFS